VTSKRHKALETNNLNTSPELGLASEEKNATKNVPQSYRMLNNQRTRWGGSKSVVRRKGRKLAVERKEGRPRGATLDKETGRRKEKCAGFANPLEI